MKNEETLCPHGDHKIDIEVFIETDERNHRKISIIRCGFCKTFLAYYMIPDFKELLEEIEFSRD